MRSYTVCQSLRRKEAHGVRHQCLIEQSDDTLVRFDCDSVQRRMHNGVMMLVVRLQANKNTLIASGRQAVMRRPSRTTWPQRAKWKNWLEIFTTPRWFGLAPNLCQIRMLQRSLVKIQSTRWVPAEIVHCGKHFSQKNLQKLHSTPKLCVKGMNVYSIQRSGWGWTTRQASHFLGYDALEK